MSNLPANRKLTDKQQLFLDNILETQGDLKLSAELAGYSGNHYQVIKSLKEEIVELASNVLAREAPKAAFKLVEVLKSDNPLPQANVKIQAENAVGVAEHPDHIETIDKELGRIAEFEDRLEVLRKYFKTKEIL